jgi:hypothetical protein
MKEGKPFALIASSKDCPELLFKHLSQDRVSLAVFLKRAKVPAGETKIGVFMSFEDFVSLARRAFRDKLEVFGISNEDERWTQK